MADRGETGRRLKAAVAKLPLMLTCAEAEAFMLDYFEESLPLKQRFVFEMHLALCRECRSYLAAYRRSVALGKRVFEHPEAAPPDDVPEDLVQAILAAREAEEPR